MIEVAYINNYDRSGLYCIIYHSVMLMVLLYLVFFLQGIWSYVFGVWELFSITRWLFVLLRIKSNYLALHNTYPKDAAIIGCFLPGYTCHYRDSNPHSANLKQVSLSWCCGNCFMLLNIKRNIILCHITHRTYGFASYPKDTAINGCFLPGYKCHYRDSNPHSANLKHQ